MTTATKAKPTAKTKRLSKAERLKELKHAIQLCFVQMDTTLAEVATKTGLHPSTVYRLWTGDYTLAIRFGTAQAMAYAAGLKLELTDSDVLISLVD